MLFLDEIIHSLPLLLPKNPYVFKWCHEWCILKLVRRFWKSVIATLYCLQTLSLLSLLLSFKFLSWLLLLSHYHKARVELRIPLITVFIVVYLLQLEIGIWNIINSLNSTVYFGISNKQIKTTRNRKFIIQATSLRNHLKVFHSIIQLQRSEICVSLFCVECFKLNILKCFD